MNKTLFQKRFWVHSVLILLLPFFIASCVSWQHTATDSGVAGQPPAKISFTILQMNDVYEIAPLEEGKVGGLARVAALRRQLLDESPNLLTVLAGDFLSPSLIGTMKWQGRRIKGRQMVEVMNHLGVDVVAFGNHELDVKEHELQQRMNESNFEWLGTNVLHRKGPRIEPFYRMVDGEKHFIPETYIWHITDRASGQSLRVGLYSACINSNQKNWVYYEDPYREAIKSYLLLNDRADIILGLTHLSIEEDMKMASILPGTALIMGGHEHENSLDTIGRVVIAKADANAKTIYVHRFTYDPATGHTTLRSELVPVTDQITPDPGVAAVVEKWQRIQAEKIAQVVPHPNEVIYRTQTPLDGREASVRNRQTNLGAIIAAGMAASLKKPADCAIFNGGSIRLDDQLRGDITAVDIFRVLPFGGAVYEIDIRGDVLKRALNAGIENAGHGGYLQWHNIEYDESNNAWKINGEKLSEGKIYHIAASEYLANGHEKRLEFFKPENFVHWETAKDTDPADLRSDIRKAVVAYLKSLK
ncbi:MAG TPA: bifunctional metallophosphatase/5'-nucleotidase [Bacteroidetes bacterium]|nr:bifunctional metallophosphatase/5'-nucleotidase [Bacteroidota bacterium]